MAEKRQPKAAVATPTPVAPVTATSGVKPRFYRLADFDFTERDGAVLSWTAHLLLGPDQVGKVLWSAARKTATVEPMGATSGAATELAKFEETAKRLLGGKDSISNLISVLIVTSEPHITPFNRALLVKDIAGSHELAYSPSLVAPAGPE